MAQNKPSYEELAKKIVQLEKELEKGRQAETELEKLGKANAKCLEDRVKLGRSLSAMRAIVNMPELSLDQDWNILGFSNNFISITDKIVEFKEQKKNLRDFLTEGGFERIQKYLKMLKELGELPYNDGKNWQLRYKGPKAKDTFGLEPGSSYPAFP